MSITINGTTGIAGVDGSATTPAFQGTDTNTGLFYGTDIVGIATGGSERVRVDSSGNVGIGTSSPGAKLDVVGSTAGGYIISRIINTSTTGYARLLFGIGTNNANGEADISYAPGIFFTLGPSSNDTTTPIVFRNNNATERMRITSGGEVYIAGTTDQGAYNLQCNGTGVWGAGAYVNGSDARIKNDITPIDDSLETVKKLNPVTYKYKEDWSKDQSVQTGFIAQELLVALEGKNYVDGIVQQGGQYMSVAYQNIIPLLTKAIQELSAKVDAQQQEINALKEAKVV